MGMGIQLERSFEHRKNRDSCLRNLKDQIRGIRIGATLGEKALQQSGIPSENGLLRNGS